MNRVKISGLGPVREVDSWMQRHKGNAALLAQLAALRLQMVIVHYIHQECRKCAFFTEQFYHLMMPENSGSSEQAVTVALRELASAGVLVKGAVGGDDCYKRGDVDNEVNYMIRLSDLAEFAVHEARGSELIARLRRTHS